MVPPEPVLLLPNHEIRVSEYQTQRPSSLCNSRRFSCDCGSSTGAAQDVTEQYSLGNVLGAGGFGITRRCFERATGEAYACKSISKRKLR